MSIAVDTFLDDKGATLSEGGTASAAGLGLVSPDRVQAEGAAFR